MKFDKHDIDHVLAYVWKSEYGEFRTPCNVFFAESVDGDLINTPSIPKQ